MGANEPAARARSRAARLLAYLVWPVALAGLLFSVGRMCLRPGVDPAAVPAGPACGPALTDRLVVVLLDGLREDTFFGPGAFAGFRAAHPAAATGMVRSTPVTMTTAGIRTMTTGTYPDFFDVLHNWDNRATPLPNVVRAARAAGKQTAIFGDSIWREMFGPDFHLAETETHLPAFLYHLSSDSRLDRILMERLLALLGPGGPADKPDFLVVHLVGLDHAGHKAGLRSERYARTTQLIAGHLDNLAAALPAGTTWLLTSDHGTTDSGGHGGASASETRLPLFAFGPGIRPGAVAPIEQMDLAPTIACLVGAELPAVSLGRPAVELFDEPAAQKTARLARAAGQIGRAWGSNGLGGQRPEQFADLMAGRPTTPARLEEAFAEVRTSLVHNAGRARLEVGLWALVLLLGLVRLGRDPRPSAPAWRRGLPWVVAAGVALLAARGRASQGQQLTLLFGNLSPGQLLLAGLVLAGAFYLLERMLSALRSPGPHHAEASALDAWFVPVLFLLQIEGGDAAVAAGTGVVLGIAARHCGARPRALFAGLALAGAVGLALVLAGKHHRVGLPPASWLPALGLLSGGLALLQFLAQPVRPPALLTPGPVGQRRGTLCLAAIPGLGYAAAVARGLGGGDRALGLGFVVAALGLLTLLLLRLTWARGRQARQVQLHAAAGASLAALWLLLCAGSQLLPAGLALLALPPLAQAEWNHRHGSPRAALHAVLLTGWAVTAWRWALVGHFEGEFGFGALELSMAYVGNPGRDVLQAVVTIVLKVFLPITVAIVLLGPAVRRNFGRAGISLPAAVSFVIGARVVHLAAAVALDSGSFYSAHVLLGELTYEVALLIPVGGLALIAGPARDRPRKVPASGP